MRIDESFSCGKQYLILPKRQEVREVITSDKAPRPLDLYPQKESFHTIEFTIIHSMFSNRRLLLRGGPDKSMNTVTIAGIAGAVWLAAGGMAAARNAKGEEGNGVSTPRTEMMKDFKKPDPHLLKKNLTAEQFAITQQCGTEPPFRNAYWDHHQPGIYVDVVSGEPLFSSLDKFDSGTGWPSFTQPIPGVDIVEKKDTGLSSVRTEVRSKQADSHLGHVFDDGPRPTGLRYCNNGVALRFVPEKV